MVGQVRNLNEWYTTVLRNSQNEGFRDIDTDFNAPYSVHTASSTNPVLRTHPHANAP